MRAACSLAVLLDTSPEEAVTFALRAQLLRERSLQPSPEQRLQAIHEFVSTLAQTPVLDDAVAGIAPSSDAGRDGS